MASGLYKTRAIVLRRRELGENDLLLTLLTPERGKLQAVARGSRKTTARLMGKLEPTMELDLSLAHGKSLDVVTEARVRADHGLLRGDLERLARAQVLLELFDQVMEGQGDSPEFYDLLAQGLTLLEAGPEGAIVMYWCQIRLIGLLGLAPEMEACTACRTTLPDYGYFSVRQGGLLCGTCSAGDDGAWRLTPGTRALYRQLCGGPPALVGRLTPERLVVRQLEEVMRSHLSYRWPHRLKSLEFLEQVERMRKR